MEREWIDMKNQVKYKMYLLHTYLSVLDWHDSGHTKRDLVHVKRTWCSTSMCRKPCWLHWVQVTKASSQVLACTRSCLRWHRKWHPSFLHSTTKNKHSSRCRQQSCPLTAFYMLPIRASHSLMWRKVSQCFVGISRKNIAFSLAFSK